MKLALFAEDLRRLVQHFAGRPSVAVGISILA